MNVSQSALQPVSQPASDAAPAGPAGPTATDPRERSWLLGLLGEHIAGTLTPAMHEAEARRQGLLLSYRVLDSVEMRPRGAEPTGHANGVDWAALVDLARQFTFDGLNVTHPAKQSVQPALDELSEDAELLGAVNTVVFRGGRAIGMNTDHRGFADALAAMGAGAGADLDRVVQLGAGGAGSATAYALLRAGVRQLTLVDVDPARVEALIARLSQAFDASRMRAATPDEAPALVRAATGLVNSTPIGMTGVSEASPIDITALHSALWVGDVVYRPLRTALVQAAERIGCETFGGSRMVVGQAAAAFELFTGLPADVSSMNEAFLAHASEA